jgi:hypothetical protein
MNDGSDSDSHPDDGGSYDGSSDEENDQNIANVDAETVAVAHRLIKSQPLKKALRKVKTKARTDEEINALNMEIKDYLTTLFNLPYCFARYQGRFVSCRCVQIAQQGCSFSFLAVRLGEFFLLILLLCCITY